MQSMELKIVLQENSGNKGDFDRNTNWGK